MANDKEFIDRVVDDFKAQLEKLCEKHKPMYYTCGNTDNMILIRVGEDEVPSPEFDSPLVKKLEKENKELNESLDFWISEAKKVGR